MEMDRIISPEERIRRAEEIYYRRKGQGVRYSSDYNNLNKRKKSIGKKLMKQLIIFILIYAAFYVIKNRDTFFNEGIINQTDSILNQNVNIPEIYNHCMEYFKNHINSIVKS